jgi:hypothetical protein
MNYTASKQLEIPPIFQVIREILIYMYILFIHKMRTALTTKNSGLAPQELGTALVGLMVLIIISAH